MERVKTPAELQQEESDAAMARQMQKDMDRRDAERAKAAAAAAAKKQSAPGPANQHAAPRDDGVVQVPCRACTFLNDVRKPVAGKKYTCAQCSTPLPMPDNLPQAKKAKEPKLEKCKICASVNRVPDKKADTALCGACYQQLGSSLEVQTPKAAAPVEQMRTVQIRCGQCSAVNAVQVSADAKVVQFECGACTTINEVSLE